MRSKTDFQAVFERLKNILAPFESRLKVVVNEPGNYSLNAGYSEEYKKDIFAAAVQIRKNYVSYHLMPVYIFPDLLDGISSGLQKRMQGKSCFNFTSIDEEILGELASLTQKGFDRFREEHLLSART